MKKDQSKRRWADFFMCWEGLRSESMFVIVWALSVVTVVTDCHWVVTSDCHHCRHLPVMFDNMLGNIFGRSKKHSNANIKDNANSGPNADNSDQFVVVGQSGTTSEMIAEEPKSLYPQVTMLTQEVCAQPITQCLNWPLVQHLRIGQSRMSFTAQRTLSQSYNSPIDNIPFAPINSSQELTDQNSMSVSKCFETIDRIQQYLSSKSQSEYNFQLENTILSESLLS